MSLYNLRSTELPSYRVTKFDSDLNVESSYNVTPTTCDCPQGHKPTCRHRKMLGNLLPIVDMDSFYDYDNAQYCSINGDLLDNVSPPLAAPAGPTAHNAPSFKDGELTIQSYRELGPLENVAEEFAKLITQRQLPSPAGPKIVHISNSGFRRRV